MGITVENLVKRFDGRTIIDHVSFDIADGELVSLLGPSGCGKTTTLRCIAGLEKPEEGRITIDGEVVFDHHAGIMLEPWHRSIGMVFQSYAIWPHLTVFENVAFPLRVRRLPRDDVTSRVTRALAMVGLGELAERSAQLLSGGQQQRVAVARAIVHSPSVLLFDEPLSNLDAKLRDQTRAEIRRLQRELNVATVYVTHDQAEALSLSDRILVMRDGVIRQSGTPQQIYAQPRDMFVADAVGAANFFDIDIRSIDGESLRGSAPDGSMICIVGRVAATGLVRVMVRPDRLLIESDAGDGVTSGFNHVRGTVRQRLFLGGHFEYAVAVGDAMLRVFSRTEIAEYTSVVVSFEPRDCILLAPDDVPKQEEGTTWD